MTLYRIIYPLTLLVAISGCGGGGGGDDDDPPPPKVLAAGSVAFSAESYSLNQNAGLLTVAVNRKNGSRDATVDYNTADDTAIAGVDYTARSGTLTWASGDSAPKTISLPISTATQNITDKTFTITLSNPTNELELGTPITATIDIVASPTINSPKVSVDGNRLIDRAGNLLQLRGVSYSGFESVAIQGSSPADPSGGQAGQPNGPNWSALKSWHANTIRFNLNEASWLGLTCIDTDGVERDADPGDNYRAAIETQVEEATAAGLYVILELQWAAPGNTCPMMQTQMANADHSVNFWTSVATTFMDNPGVMFALYNEPYFYGLSSPSNQWSALMNGGTFSYYPASSGTNNQQRVDTTWTSAGMQQLLDAVRATGATNVVLVGGVGFSNDMSGWLDNMPNDSLGQMAAAWHASPPIQVPQSVTIAEGGSGYTVGDVLTLDKSNAVYQSTVITVTGVGVDGAVTEIQVNINGLYLQTALPSEALACNCGSGSGATFALGGWATYSSNWSTPENWPVIQELSVSVPVILAETGEHNAEGTVGAPFLQELLPFANANNLSVIGCCWNIFAQHNNVLIKDVDGTPTDGYGQVFHDWMIGAKWQ